MKKFWGIFFLFVWGNAFGALPSPDSGNLWQLSCNERGTEGKALCAAYVSGVLRGAQLDAQINEKDPYLCIPEGVTMIQATDVFAKYLRDHPELRHKDAASLVFISIKTAFPCIRN